MLRTAGLLALPKRALSAGFDARISPCAAAQLLGGWGLTETGLAPASRVRLIWTHWLVDLAIVCHWVLDVPNMRRYAATALARAEGAGRDDLAAGALGALALADASDGQLATSLSQFQGALARAGEIRTVPLPAAVHMSALVLYFLGRYPEAIERAREMIAVGRAVNDTSTTTLAMGHLALALMGSGRYGEAMQELEEMRRFAQEYGVGRGLARSLGLRAGLHLEVFDFAAAEALAEEAREVARRLSWGHPVISGGIDLLLNFARSRRVGHTEKLVGDVAEAVHAGAGNHGWLWRLRFTQARSELALARGDWNEALQSAGEVIGLSRATGRVKYEVDGLAARGKALAGLGRKHEAIATLQEAAALARPVGDPALLLRAATALLGVEGNDALAAEAGSAAQRMAAALPEGEMRRRFEASEPVQLICDYVR
jgi:tetratricopeptide (TPR) repeat protein